MPEKSEIMITSLELNQLIQPPRSMHIISTEVKKEQIVCLDNIDYKSTLNDGKMAIDGISHHGKLINISLINNKTQKKATIVLHLGMSGCVRFLDNYNKEEEYKNNTVKIVLYSMYTKKYHTLLVIDPRSFGKIYFTEESFISWIKSHGLAKDIMAYEDNDFIKNFVYHAQKMPNKTIKEFLLDQNRCAAGVGNYLASEVLHRSKIHPETTLEAVVDADNSKEITSLILKNIHEIVKTMLMSWGVAMRDFVSPTGKRGNGEHFLIAYGRKGQTCTLCKDSKIVRKEIAGRPTYFCPNCQEVLLPKTKDLQEKQADKNSLPKAKMSIPKFNIPPPPAFLSKNPNANSGN